MVARGTLSYDDFQAEGQLGSRAVRVLIRVQELVSARGPYNYLEIGSYLGRSLQPHLQDPDCQKALSIDLRPDVTPDERGNLGDYSGITADDMKTHLAQFCAKGDFRKLTCITDTSDVLRKSKSKTRYDLAFIDGEHTHIAAFRDFLNVTKVMKEEAVICFDDSSLVYSGIKNALYYLEHQNMPHASSFARGEITVIAIGKNAQEIIDGLDSDTIRAEHRVARQMRNRTLKSAIDNAEPAQLLKTSRNEILKELQREGYQIKRPEDS